MPSSTLAHEVAGHATQHIWQDGRVRYVPGLLPTMRDVLTREPAAYHLRSIEIEARLRELQRQERIAHAIDRTLPDPEDPKNARERLKEVMMNRDRRDGVEGLPGVFLRNLSPDQKELFLDYWSKRMPGLVDNRRLQHRGNLAGVPSRTSPLHIRPSMYG